jgi:GNAT superfamily N-acetyltransferase
MDARLSLPEGLTVRPATAEDADAITALIGACELDADGVAEVDLDDVLMGFGRAGFDPATDMVLVHDGERLVGWAEVYKGRAEADVHPDLHRRGLGASILAWTETRALELGSRDVGQTKTDNDTAAAELFRDKGYEPTHTSWILQVRFDEGPPPPSAPPEGITLRPYDPARDERGVHRLIDDAFCEWPGREPWSFEEWAPLVIRHGAFAPELSPLAFDGDELVGAALSFDYEDAGEGWINQLATKATHRYRGIARALLLRAFGDFYARGERACGISTDSRTGAMGLYERVGMSVRRSYTRFTKPL